MAANISYECESWAKRDDARRRRCLRCAGVWARGQAAYRRVPVPAFLCWPCLRVRRIARPCLRYICLRSRLEQAAILLGRDGPSVGAISGRTWLRSLMGAWTDGELRYLGDNKEFSSIPRCRRSPGAYFRSCEASWKTRKTGPLRVASVRSRAIRSLNAALLTTSLSPNPKF